MKTNQDTTTAGARTHTLTNSFHGTEINVRKSAEEIESIDNKIWSGSDLTTAEKTWVRKVRNTLCGVEGCTCGDNLGRRG